MIAGKSLNSVVFKEEDLTSSKLKKLLQEQSKKNEFLNEKNIRLSIQLKSLLELLQKKDKNILEIEKDKDGKWTRKRFACGRIQKWIWRARRRRFGGVFELIKKQEGKIERLRLRGSVLVEEISRLGLKRLKNVLRMIEKGNEDDGRIVKLCRKVEVGIYGKCFREIKTFGDWRNNEKIKRLKGLKNLQSFCSIIEKSRRLVDVCFFVWKNTVKNYCGILSTFVRIQRSKIRFCFYQIFKFSAAISKQLLQHERRNSENKCKVFRKAFISLNTFCLLAKVLKSFRKKIFFSKWHKKRSILNITGIVNCLKPLIKSHFQRIFQKSPKNPFKTLISLEFSLKSFAFYSISNYSFNLSKEMHEFEAKTLETQNKILKSSIEETEKSVLDLQQENFQIKKNFESAEKIKISKHQLLNTKKNQCNELEVKIAKVLEEIQKSQIESEQKTLSDEENIEKLVKKTSENNSKIESIEKNIDFYCGEIQKLENEGRSAALQLTQIESSLKKAQELYNSAISEKSRMASIEAESKKQKISLIGKIDALGEEKEKILETISQVIHEKQQILSDIQDKRSKFLELESEICELEAKSQVLIEKKKRLADNLDEDFDLKGNLLTHKQKELQKLKENLSYNKSHIENLLKELNSKIKSEEKERSAKFSLELNSISYKNEEVLRDISIETQKLQSISFNIQNLSQEKEKTQEELKSLQDSLTKASQANQSLKDKLSTSINQPKTPVEDFSPGLKEYSQSLEEKIKDLTEELANAQASNKLTSVRAAYEVKIKKLEMKLKECQEYAMNSRVDVAEAIAEIEHYANILNVMEEKMNETEERVLICLREKESAAEDLAKIREAYFGFIAKG